jgi:hypothetical protein
VAPRQNLSHRILDPPIPRSASDVQHTGSRRPPSLERRPTIDPEAGSSVVELRPNVACNTLASTDFTPRELERAKTLQAADASLQGKPFAEVAAMLREIPIFPTGSRK